MGCGTGCGIVCGIGCGIDVASTIWQKIELHRNGLIIGMHNIRITILIVAWGVALGVASRVASGVALMWHLPFGKK